MEYIEGINRSLRCFDVFLFFFLKCNFITERDKVKFDVIKFQFGFWYFLFLSLDCCKKNIPRQNCIQNTKKYRNSEV